MTYVALPTKNPGDVLTSALWNTYLQGNADSGFMRMLADTTVVGSVAANIDFTSILGAFAHLMLVLYARGDTAAGQVNVSMRLNNDSAADYHQQILDANNATVTAVDAGAAAVTASVFGVIPAATAPANAFGHTDLVLSHYANALNQKEWRATGYAKIAATGAGCGTLRTAGGVWMAAVAAVNRLTIFPAVGNFAIGTRATLYGLPA